MSEIEQVVGLQDEIHNLKKHKDALFEKMYVIPRCLWILCEFMDF